LRALWLPIFFRNELTVCDGPFLRKLCLIWASSADKNQKIKFTLQRLMKNPVPYFMEIVSGNFGN